MGKHDNRRSRKMRQRVRQRKFKARAARKANKNTKPAVEARKPVKKAAGAAAKS